MDGFENIQVAHSVEHEMFPVYARVVRESFEPKAAESAYYFNRKEKFLQRGLQT